MHCQGVDVQIVYLFCPWACLPPGIRGFPGERSDLLEAACLGLGHGMGVCQYFNNWPSWTSSYQAYIDPPASGIHLPHAVWSSPTSANLGGLPTTPPPQPPSLSLLSQPSRILLKYFKTI